MPRYEIKVTHEPKIEAPKFTAEQMESFGRYSMQVMKERLAQAIDVFDRPAKPLQPKYAKRKSAKGLPAVRDLRLTGNMLGSIHVKNADSTHVTVKVEGATPFRKGIFNQNIDPWFGLSSHDDQRVLKEKVQPIFSQNLNDMLG
jgi:hypothetical protein